MLIAWVVVHERPRLLKFSLMVAGAMGVALLLLSGRTTVDWLGAAAGLGAAFSLAMGGILMNRWRRPAPLLIFTGWQLGIELGILAALIGDVPTRVSGAEMFGLAYLAIISTTIAYSLWFYCIAAAGASVAALFCY